MSFPVLAWLPCGNCSRGGGGEGGGGEGGGTAEKGVGVCGELNHAATHEGYS